MEQRHWYVIYAKAHKEAVVQAHLELKGLRVFFPRLLLPESSRNRIVPLFPNYLFVHLLFSRESHYVVWTPGVKYTVSFSGTPASLDDRIVAFLAEQATAEGIIRVWPKPKAGEHVQVAAGPLVGVVGILEEPPKANGRVKVLMGLLGRQVKVELPVEFLRKRTDRNAAPRGYQRIGPSLLRIK